MSDYKARIKGTTISTTRVVSDNMQLLKESIKHVHRNTIARWRPLAEEYGFAALVDEAERLLDANGQPTDANLFRALVEEIKQVVAEENVEREVIPVARVGQKFKDGPRQSRGDELGKTMLATLLGFCEKHSRRPSAFELAKELPTDGRYVQEVAEDGLGEFCILWKRPNGKQEKTYFQDFKKRYTRLLNKHPEIKKQYSKKK